MLESSQIGRVIKSNVCDEVYNGLAQQWREKVEIQLWEQRRLDYGCYRHLGYTNTETIVIEKRPKYRL